MAKKLEEDYFKFLKNKEVILVAPAGYLDDMNKGKEIDSFDLVIRLNQAIPINNIEDRGERTDILYHTLFNRPQMYKEEKFLRKKDLINEQDVSLWKEQEVKWLITYEHGLWKKRTKLVKEYLNKISWTTIPFSLCNLIKKNMNTIPNTGICAIVHLLCADIKSLHITGFDFHTTGAYYFKDNGNFSSVRELSEQWHNTNFQIKYLREIWLNDNRLIIDDKMKEILSEVGDQD